MNLAIKVGKAVLGAAVVVTAAEKVGPKLPDALVVKGYDTRPYVAGGLALLGLLMIPMAKKVAVPA